MKALQEMGPGSALLGVGVSRKKKHKRNIMLLRQKGYHKEEGNNEIWNQGNKESLNHSL